MSRFTHYGNSTATKDDVIKYINSSAKKAYNKGAEISGYVQKQYPAIIYQGRNLTRNAAQQSKYALETTVKRAGSIACAVGNQLRHSEKSLLMLGFIYAVYKLIVADDEKVTQATKKLKAKINEKPVQSAIIALGAGFLLSRFFK